MKISNRKTKIYGVKTMVQRFEVLHRRIFREFKMANVIKSSDNRTMKFSRVMLIYLTPPYCYAVTVVYTTNHIICQGQDDQNTSRWPSRSLAHTNETNANSSLLGIRGSVQYHDQSNNISPLNAGYVALLVLVTLVMSVTLLFIFYLSTTIQSDTNRDGDSRLSTVRSPTLLNYKLRALKRKQSLEEELAPVLQLKKDDIIVQLAEPRPNQSSEL